MTRVAVTGATGFIGRHLVAHLVEQGFSVRAVTRRPTAAWPDVVVAPLEAAALADAFRGVEVVVHLAAVVSALRADDYARVNVAGTRAVAEAAHASGARLVHVSSLAAAGPAPASAPRRESDPASPITAYGRSKLDAERVVAALDGLRWTVLRPAAVYGPGDRAMLPLFRFAARGLMPLVGRPTAAYTFVYVDDVVRAIRAAIDRDAIGDAVFVGHPVPVTARRILEAVREAVGTRAAIARVPNALTWMAAAAGDIGGAIARRPLPLNRSRYAELSAEGFVCGVERLRDRLGVEAEVALGDGLARTAEWYRKEGWL